MTPASSSGPGDTTPRGTLGLALQEAFTVTVRLRTGRQVASDAGSFRTQMKSLLMGADRAAREAGYAAESVKYAIYAFVAFLDESVLNSSQPMFSDWTSQPLQEEIFGDHMAGETFFRHLRELMGRQDSEELADVLEVYLLCLLLGFKGRFAAAGSAQVSGLAGEVEEKIRRIRGGVPPLAPSWRPPEESVAPPRDPWVPRMVVGAAFALVLAVALFVLFTVLLGSPVREAGSLLG